MHQGLPGDTIAAVATAAGVGGIGVIRISGPNALEIGRSMCGRSPAPRYAEFCHFKDSAGDLIDSGLVLYFKAPHSFTGEDIIELQGHGGPVVLDMLLRETLRSGARLAGPGEFSQRAYINDKLDLAQAEAIADIIAATTEAGVRSAQRSLQGEFSCHIDSLLSQLLELRIYVEASIDFPEEEIDFLADGDVRAKFDAIKRALNATLATARQGRLLRDGMNVVIAGRPNAGKSSLLNALSGQDSAIVTPIEGTTRDVLREHIQIDGMPIHIIDTAGLRDSNDVVEKEGIERTWREMRNADRLLLVFDTTPGTDAFKDTEKLQNELKQQLPDLPISLIANKCDLSGRPPGLGSHNDLPCLTVSARDQIGLTELKTHLKDVMGFQAEETHGFMARTRHIDALERAQHILASAALQMGYGELLAEDLRAAHNALGEITGAMSADEMLGEIFSSFCIGK